MDGDDVSCIGVCGALILGGLWLMKSDRAKVRRCLATTFGRIVRVDEDRSKSN